LKGAHQRTLSRFS